jgi:type II secretory pathway pseudopilin PulG
MDPPKTDGKAIGSLIAGILSLTIFSCVAGIPAIVLGHMSRSAIQKSMGRLKGDGMALAGLIMGYVSLVAIPVILIVATIAIPSLLRARQAASETAAVATLRTIDRAEEQYLLSGGRGSYGDLRSLVQAGLIDAKLAETTNGYDYSIVADGNEFTAAANPATTNTGRFGYFVTKDTVIRYSTNPLLAPTGRAGEPVY